MKKSWVENIIAGSYAIALHIVLVVLLFIGFGSDPSTVVAPAAVDIVQATVLDEQQVLDDVAERCFVVADDVMASSFLCLCHFCKQLVQKIMRAKQSHTQQLHSAHEMVTRS